MKKALKKVLALLCCAGMMLGLAACGQSDSSASEGTADTGTTDTANTDTAAAGNADLLNEVGTYPIVNEPITLNIMIMSKPYIEDYNTNDFTAYIEELTGINLEVEAVSYEDSQEKINLAMSSGEYPDVFMTLDPDVVKYGVKEQMFIPLDDLIEENMPNFMATSSGLLDQLRQSDGHIYGMPSINEAYHTFYSDKMWVNSYALEQMGLEMPTTTEEFYNVCKTYLDQNPNGVAIADTYKGDAINWIMNSFILTPNDAHGSHISNAEIATKCVVDPEGNVISAATQNQYKEGLEFIKSLYDMGAFYEGNFSAQEDSMKSLINQEGEPVLFFPALYSSKFIDSTVDNEMYRHYEVISPIAGPDGVQRTPYYMNDGVYENRFVITDQCENPAAALRFLDWFYQEKSYVMAQYGTEEGTDFIWQPEGEVGVNGEPALYTLLNGYTTDVQNHDWQVTSLFYGTSKVRLGESVAADLDKYDPTALEKFLYEETKEKMEPYAPKAGDNSLLPVMHLTSEEQDELSIPVVESSNYIKQSQASFITGAMDIEKDWDTYLQQLDGLGLPQVLSVYQTVVDRSGSN